MSDYNTTITAVSVHKDGDNPIFGESVTVAEIDDDGGGPFIVLKQQMDDQAGRKDARQMAGMKNDNGKV